MEPGLSSRARLNGRSELPALVSNLACRRFSEILELGPGVGDLLPMNWMSSGGGIVGVLKLDLRFIL